MMCQRLVCCLTMLSLLNGVARCGEEAPVSAAPAMATIVSVDANEGSLVCMSFTSRPVYQTRYETVIQNGRPVEQAFQAVAPVWEAATRKFTRADTRIETVSGEKLKMEDAARQLKKGSPVLISADGRPIDDFYRRFFKPDLPVLIVKNMSRATVIPPPAVGPPSYAPPLKPR